MVKELYSNNDYNVGILSKKEARESDNRFEQSRINERRKQHRLSAKRVNKYFRKRNK